MKLRIIMETGDSLFTDKSIKNLLKEGKIDFKTYIALRGEKITSLTQLIDFYKEHLEFTKIKNIGRKTNNQLIEIIAEYIDFKLPEDPDEITKKEMQPEVETTNTGLKQIKISTLLKDGKIDVRTFNVLEREEIYNVYDIIRYHKTYKMFNNLKNAGRRTDEYLKSVVIQYQGNKNYNNEDRVINDTERNETKEIIINQDIEVIDIPYYDELSIRTKNIINYSELSTIRKILENYEHYGNFLNLRNCGLKSNKELVNFAKQIKTSISSSSKTLPFLSDYFIKLKNKIKNWFTLDITKNEELCTQYLENRIEVFYFIKLCAQSFLDERDFIIYSYRKKLYERGNRLTLEQIGDLLKITRERVRQVVCQKIEIFDKNIISFFTEINEYKTNFKKYLPEEPDIIIIDDDFAKKINFIENCNFSKRYIAQILGVLYKENYINYFHEEKPKRNNEYLIKKEITESTKIYNIVDNVKNILNKNINGKNICLKEIISDYIDIIDEVIATRVKNIIETIMINEYNARIQEVNDVMETEVENKFTEEIKLKTPIQQRVSASLEELYDVKLWLHLGKEYGHDQLRCYLLEIRHTMPNLKRNAKLLTAEELRYINIEEFNEIITVYLQRFFEPRQINEFTNNMLKNTKSEKEIMILNFQFYKINKLEYFKNNFIVPNTDVLEDNPEENFSLKSYETITYYIGKYKTDDLRTLKGNDEKTKDDLVPLINNNDDILKNLNLREFVKTTSINYGVNELQLFAMI